MPSSLGPCAKGKEPKQVLETKPQFIPQPLTQTHLSYEHITQYILLRSAYYEQYLSQKYLAHVNISVQYAAKRARQPLSTNHTKYIP